MSTDSLDFSRVLHGAFSSTKQPRNRITDTMSGFFVEKMRQVMLKKPWQSNLFGCREVFGG